MPEASFIKSSHKPRGGSASQKASYGVCFPQLEGTFLVFVNGLAVVKNVPAINSRNSRFAGFNSRLAATGIGRQPFDSVRCLLCESGAYQEKSKNSRFPRENGAFSRTFYSRPRR
jgi:hypothetical protein